VPACAQSQQEIKERALPTQTTGQGSTLWQQAPIAVQLHLPTAAPSG